MLSRESQDRYSLGWYKELLAQALQKGYVIHERAFVESALFVRDLCPSMDFCHFWLAPLRP